MDPFLVVLKVRLAFEFDALAVIMVSIFFHFATFLLGLQNQKNLTTKFY